MKEVRGKLMALMKKHQMDTTEFSEKCGIKEERVERLLGGRGKPSHLERMCIAEAFGMTEEELQDIEPLSQTEVREVQTDGIEKVIAERLQELVKIHGIGIPELAERCSLKRQRAKKLMSGKMNTLKLHKLGIDIGSTTVKIAILDEQNTLVFSDYERHFANIRETLTDLLHKAYEKLGQMDENEAQKYLEMMMPMKKGLS